MSHGIHIVDRHPGRSREQAFEPKIHAIPPGSPEQQEQEQEQKFSGEIANVSSIGAAAASYTDRLPSRSESDLLQPPLPSEVFLKKVHGPDFSVSRDYSRLLPPTIPSEFIFALTEDDDVTEKVIGHGSFGAVVSAVLYHPPDFVKEVVMKETFEQHFRDIVHEARAAMYLERTGFVPTCFGLTVSGSGGLLIVQECFAKGVTLQMVLVEELLPIENERKWLYIACQLAEGLAKIHAFDVLLNDIKEDNVLVDLKPSLPVVKYCDLGSSTYKKGCVFKSPDSSRSHHLSPEACVPNAVTNQANDVFGLGNMLRNIHRVTNIAALVPVAERCRCEAVPESRGTADEAYRDLYMEYTRAENRWSEDLESLEDELIPGLGDGDFRNTPSPRTGDRYCYWDVLKKRCGSPINVCHSFQRI